MKTGAVDVQVGLEVSSARFYFNGREDGGRGGVGRGV